MTTETRNGDWMQTAHGRVAWPLDPRPEDIYIDDIATALARQCRYAGHIRGDVEHYSVAQHSVLISDYVIDGMLGFGNETARELALWGLLHDASEAYLVDVPRPIKGDLIGYKDIEDRLMRCIAKRFGLPLIMPAYIKRLDNAILANEKRDVMAPAPRDWALTEPPIPGIEIGGWCWRKARYEFMKRFHALYGGD